MFPKSLHRSCLDNETSVSNGENSRFFGSGGLAQKYLIASDKRKPVGPFASPSSMADNDEDTPFMSHNCNQTI